MDDGTLLVLDAGTGLRNLGRLILQDPPAELHLLLSHLHMDHLEGLGFFAPLFSSDVRIHIWGPPSPVSSLQERIARYLSPPLFPVRIGEVPSRPEFHDAPAEPWAIGSARILAHSVAHQGPTLGFRIEADGRSVAYLPDHEPMRGGDVEGKDPRWVSGYDIAAGADLLVHDSQYTEEEYPDRVGWGHSSVAHVVSFANITGAKRLLLFHHDPVHTDEMLELKMARARELWKGASENAPELSREGMEINL